MEESLYILYYLGVILIFTKFMGVMARKIGLPQVAGMVIGGVMIGLISNLSNPDNFLLNLIINPNEEELKVLSVFSQIGVIFILFSSGLETNFDDFKKSGASATFIAILGVLAPMIIGTLGALFFMNGYAEFTNEKFLNAIFISAILAATSVGITVETLKELGKLNTKLGQTIVSAAIIDDVLGIIALSIVTSLKSGGAEAILITLLKAVGFFAFSIIVGLAIRKFFIWRQSKYTHKRRTGIYELGVCFIFAFVSEEFFGIASITGAYMAGLMLSGLNDSHYVDRKITVSGYMIFSPIFFSLIGIKADFSGFTLSYLIFALVFVFLGIAGKIIGCSSIARLFKFSKKESLIAGCGMIARGEVALAVYATGAGLIAPEASGGIDPLLATILLIVTTSILCPVFLKILFREKHKTDADVSDNQAQVS